MALMPDRTWSFDASPAYSEFQEIWPGHTCTSPLQQAQSITTAYFRDNTIVRHGTHSARVNATSTAWHGYDYPNCYRLRVQALISSTGANGMGEVQGSEGWYAFSIRLPSNFPSSYYSWATFDHSVDHNTHPSFGLVNMAIQNDNWVIQWHTGFTNPAPSFQSAYQPRDILLGPSAPSGRPFAKGIWHDFYWHVVWSAMRAGDVTPVFTMWHRPENGSFAKIYSNQPGSGALLQKPVHPTLQWNAAYGAPGENGSPGLHGGNYGSYRPASGATSVQFWIDGFRRRQSEAAILAEFPDSGITPTEPPAPATGRSRMGLTNSGTLTAIGNNFKRTIKRDSIPSLATIDIHTFYAWLAGPPSGGSQSFRAVVYQHDGADPSTRYGFSNEVIVAQGAPAAWVQLSPSTPIRATAPVSIGLITGGASTGSVGVQTVTNGLWVNADTYADLPTDPFGTATLGNIEIAICADYTVVVDLTAPTYVTGQINQAAVVLSFSEEFDPASVPDESAFTVYVDGVARALSNDLQLSGSSVLFTLVGDVNVGETVTFDYTMPATNRLRDLAAVPNNTASITGASIFNSTQAPQIPGVQRIPGVARLSGTRIPGTRIS